MYSIYVLTNTVNGKKYVGFTGRGLRQRWLEHRRNANAGSIQCRLYSAIRKYGVECFTIEEVFTSDNRELTLREMEPYYIRLLETFGPKGYNANEGGWNTNTDEKRAAASERMKQNNPNAGNKHNNGFKKGYIRGPITEDERAKRRSSKLGHNNPNYGKVGNSLRLNVLVTCSVCGTSTNKGNHKRWHEGNCKSNARHSSS